MEPGQRAQRFRGQTAEVLAFGEDPVGVGLVGEKLAAVEVRGASKACRRIGFASSGRGQTRGDERLEAVRVDLDSRRIEPVKFPPLSATTNDEGRRRCRSGSSEFRTT